MSENFGNDRKSARGEKAAVSRVTLALVLVLVLLLNIFVTHIGKKYLWYTDLTKTRYKMAYSPFYTLSEPCRELIGNDAIPAIKAVNEERKSRGEEEIKLNIVFCRDEDLLDGNTYMRYVHRTAMSLENEFRDQISVKYVNIEKNPSAVQKYKTTSAANIYDTNVIIEFGGEFAVHSLKSFFTADSDSDEPWAYNGEKKFSASILSLTRAESPICCITANHGETIFDESGNIKEKYSEFIKMIEKSGYEVRKIDFEKEEIPENCRLVLIFDPQTDFLAYGNTDGDGSEIEKLDKFLDKANNCFYVFDGNSPYLENLEEYLSEWGISHSGMDGSLYSVGDSYNCIDGSGENVIGKYATEGAGASITEDMRNVSTPAKVIFPRATSISASDTYNYYYDVNTSTNKAVRAYYHYYKNGISRDLYDVFSTFESGYLGLGGKTYEMADEDNLFSLMTVTVEDRDIQEDNFGTVTESSNFVCLSSTEFFGNDLLGSSSFGNADVITGTLRAIGRETVPVNMDMKAFYVYDIEDAKAYASVNTEPAALVLLLLPPSFLLICGIFVTVRRKYR